MAKPYKIRNGRKLTLHTGASNGVQHLVSLIGTVATFECLQGHRIRHDYSKGPISKRIPESSLLRFRTFWGLDPAANGVRGHCYGWCQTCQNIMDKEEQR